MKKREILLYIIPFIFIGIGLYTLFLKNYLTASESNFLSYDDNTIFYSNDKERIPQPINASIEVHFSPDENIPSYLSKLIKQEKIAIWCAAFRFTDKILAQDLIDALRRGVKVILVIDREGFSAIQSKLLHLFKEGIPIYVFPPITSDELKMLKNEQKKENKFGSQALMHNKFMIFHSQKIICTGSYNYTKSAATQNQENILIIQDIPKIFNAYSDQFKIICERSTVFLNK